MFKATTRRVKGDLSAQLSGIKYESFIHEAQPAAAPGREGFMALTPIVKGGAMAYGSMTGPFATEAAALADSLAGMRSTGWRETREEAEQDAAEEIERRTQYRADGRPRFKA